MNNFINKYTKQDKYNYTPVLLSIFILFGLTFYLILRILIFTGWNYVYPLDDAYIHLSIAKNLVQHGVWGITKFGFTSSSSSPLWTLLISLMYLIFGVGSFAPLILNLIFAVILLFIVYKIQIKYEISSLNIYFAMVSFVLFIPLPALVIIGQEHVLHILLLTSSLYYFNEIVSQEQEIQGKKEQIKFYILLFLMTAVRYEALFFIFSAFVILLIFRKYVIATLTLVFGSLPVIIYGIISKINGWYFLPNSVLLKGNRPDFSLTGIYNLFFHTLKTLYSNPHILAILIISLLILFLLLNSNGYSLKTDSKINANYLIILFLGTCILHSIFARFGWLFRYEAYLIAFFIFVILVGINELLKYRDKIKYLNYILIGGLFIAVLPLGIKFIISMNKITIASKNIYEQPFQTARFIHEFYNNKNNYAIGLNDIGAVNYYNNINCIDLAGLGNLDMARLEVENKLNSKTISELIRKNDIKILIINEKAFKQFGGIPSELIRVAEWHIPDNYICYDSVLNFLAKDTTEAILLKKNLEKFMPMLPADVKVKIY